MITAAQAEDEIAATKARGGQVLAACEPTFPIGLAALTPPPPVISVCGQAGLLQKPMVGIVGARNASAAGLRLARCKHLTPACFSRSDFVFSLSGGDHLDRLAACLLDQVWQCRQHSADLPIAREQAEETNWAYSLTAR